MDVKLLTACNWVWYYLKISNKPEQGSKAEECKADKAIILHIMTACLELVYNLHTAVLKWFPLIIRVYNSKQVKEYKTISFDPPLQK